MSYVRVGLGDFDRSAFGALSNSVETAITVANAKGWPVAATKALISSIEDLGSQIRYAIKSKLGGNMPSDAVEHLQQQAKVEEYDLDSYSARMGGGGFFVSSDLGTKLHGHMQTLQSLVSSGLSGLSGLGSDSTAAANSYLVQQVQNLLNQKGEHLSADGVAGPLTSAALSRQLPNWQSLRYHGGWKAVIEALGGRYVSPPANVQVSHAAKAQAAAVKAQAAAAAIVQQIQSGQATPMPAASIFGGGGKGYLIPVLIGGAAIAAVLLLKHSPEPQPRRRRHHR